MSIEIKHVSKAYDAFQILKDINLTIPSGELVALLGPSGSGKTSLLRIVAGLEEPDQGQIIFHGENLTEASIKERQVGFVFQHYALFQNMTVFDNIAYGLRVRPRKIRPSRREIRERVDRLLRLVRLEPYGKRYPSQLSGGQKQRVALARALAIEPKILLLDEPFGALDAKVRKELRFWLRHLHESVRVTSIFVTHDQEEAFEVADRVVIIRDGKIEQIGTPEDVYEYPANPFVYDFIGSANRFEGKITHGKFIDGAFETEVPEYADHESGGLGFVRPHHFIIEKNRSGKQSIPGTVKHIHAAGPTIRIEVERSDTHDFLNIELNREEFAALELHAGQPTYIRPKKVQVFVTTQ
ncbi:sulfate/molybdate ABC transporter ATP-binding protein [Sporolactobacillus sp. THM19-2]|uniref:sulfate/molybdate ABC transporter ATP-binding protein n=1 Tax=Sporolactobacillus sp. THM19-2 TaxID=2511171 RepID=UPI0010201206|nr:sulfate/molybdate ABC transporter ATP-binding protein [Sporolactobacillus sp. THM19-2]RYL90951.1 sulfate/molybdate ABC transporter ATP-binding protein [Sporolactobacillus sp. THM19-2]